MNERQKYGILWGKWMKHVVAVFWGLATYLGLLFGAMCLASLMSKGDSCERASAAYMGVVLAAGLHWIVFAMIEHGYLKHINKDA